MIWYMFANFFTHSHKLTSGQDVSCKLEIHMHKEKLIWQNMNKYVGNHNAAFNMCLRTGYVLLLLSEKNPMIEYLGSSSCSRNNYNYNYNDDDTIMIMIIIVISLLLLLLLWVLISLSS